MPGTTPQPTPSGHRATHEETEDLVVLLDEAGELCGTAPRESVHDADTPLHLAFSCWLLDTDGRLLLTRRALTKRSWPGVWTNSFCGHPRPGETFDDAVPRYAQRELGVAISDLVPLVPDFAYRAVDASGVVENEVCPVFAARVVGEVDPAPDEVMEHAWVPLDEVRSALQVSPWALSPWMREQAEALEATDGWATLAAHAAAPAARGRGGAAQE
ncbi:isopentenyl-diphosphate Delta-isomerase [Nocardioides daphniae]|uniref:Isopentenyl-diphosphate Delta-isomerase n=1 Tax=Nocardioides daphniae TaxID=402297 RepID=A0A4P7UC17_9ACTN|nr:isopentenyl-diphosphate Delta-isomerase [Nocardioides daphniae]QCC77546.1 isopentenyl-diphosphate Delta-isomerase [Nocardioides daphniae]GGD30903.1 isopentenyl-diphosphate Delta-isomerase [Nocardioides daphniae]